jgi:hypothetical protein
MSDLMVYEIEPKNKYFEAIRAIAEYEIRPGNSVSFVSEVDLSEVERVRRRAVGERKPSYTAFVVKAIALALKEFPYANRRVIRRAWPPFGGARLHRFHHCDVAVMVERDIPGAESVAFLDILRNADRLSLAEVTNSLYDLATCDVQTNRQWREFSALINRLPSWLSNLLIRLPCNLPSWWVKYRGAAAMISSPAKYGVDVIVGTWSHPLGISFGLVRPRPVVRGDQIVACPTFALTMNFDRRVMAGAQAAHVFKRMVDLLEHAETAMAPYWSDVAPVQAEPLEPAGMPATVVVPESPIS